jgi:hypothetical protein
MTHSAAGSKSNRLRHEEPARASSKAWPGRPADENEARAIERACIEALASDEGDLLGLAALMRLTPREAIALPTVVEVAARKVESSVRVVIAEGLTNPELRELLRNACRIAAESLKP